MNAYRIDEEARAALDALLQRDEYKKKQNVLNEYSSVVKGLETQNKKITAALEAEDFDTAVNLKEEIEILEKKKEIMEPHYKKCLLIPDYPTEDVIAIASEVKNTVSEAVDELEEKQRKLLEQVVELEHQKQLLARQANNTAERTLYNTAVKNIPQKDQGKFKIKFPVYSRESFVPAEHLLKEAENLYLRKNS